jgi:hypothetical protein
MLLTGLETRLGFTAINIAALAGTRMGGRRPYFRIN